MKAKSAATLIGVSLLVGCSNQTPQVMSRASPVAELQIAVGECMAVSPAEDTKTPEGVKTLTAALAKVFISSGVNYLGQAATKAGEAKTWKMQGSRNFEALATTFPQCIQVVRGRFLTDGVASAEWIPPQNSQWPDNTKSLLDRRGLYLAGMPDFLFEAQIVPSTDKKAFAIRPGIATYFSPIDTRFLRPGKERSIALFFAFTPPGTKPTLDNNPSATVLLGAMQPWTTRKYAVDGKSSSVYESPWFTIGREDASKSLTLTVLMTETQGEQAFLKYIGSVLSEPTVVAAANADLQNRFVPSVRQANQRANELAEITAENARDTSFKKYAEKITACATEPDVATRRSLAGEAKQAIKDYVDAEKDLVSPKQEISAGLARTINVNGDSSALQKKCSALASKLPK